jgi:hypothetical protein
MSGVCRVCGAECAPSELLAVHEGGGCIRCNGSPACTRCGHTRRQHRGTFGGGDPGCKARVNPDDSLAVGRCGCIGYTVEPSALWDEVPIVEVVEVRLRRQDDDSNPDLPLEAPVRDLFDERRRSEVEGVPWRPPS